MGDGKTVAGVGRRAWRTTRLCLCAGVLALAGCSTSQQNRAASAATTPFSDLNLLQAAIPDVLAQARRAPYALPESRSCPQLATAVSVLDEVLGPDLDAPSSESHPSLLERGADVTSDAAIGAVQRTAEGVIPFRGWIRKLSGAERRSREVAAAITAGGVRRAYLRGLAAAQGCPAPAAAPAPASSPVPAQPASVLPAS